MMWRFNGWPNLNYLIVDCHIYEQWTERGPKWLAQSDGQAAKRSKQDSTNEQREEEEERIDPLGKEKWKLRSFIAQTEL